MIGLIDYGVGNIRAFANIYKSIDVPYKICKSVSDLEDCTKVVLPGVGAFDHAMEKLYESGMKEKLDDMVLNQKVPVVGICVGMQMLAKRSDEGTSEGLGWIDAEVKRFDVTKIQYATHLPHMGWNDILPNKANPILKGLEKDAKFYFLHSFYFSCNKEEDAIASTEYGINFTCVVNRQNIFGVQFHPEKSHQFGITLLKNFSEL